MFPPVIRLLLHGCPPAIRRAVSLGVVDPVNGQSELKAGPHVINEVFKGHPPLANGNTFRSIKAKRRMPFVEAALLHSPPNPVEFRAYLIETLSDKPSLSSLGGGQTSARLHISSVQVRDSGNFYLSTITPAHPKIPFDICISGQPKWVNGHKSAKSFTGKIIALCVKITNYLLSHIASSFRVVVSASLQPNTAVGRAHFYLRTH